MAILKVGSKGQAVIEVQRMLGVNDDGHFGKITEKITRIFQEKNGLLADGIVGPKTLAALKKHGFVNQVETTFTPSGGFQLSARSLSNLEGVHPDLVKVINHAITITPLDFMVIEGARTKAKQIEYYKAGKSKTIKGGRHVPENNRVKLSHAVDLGAFVDGKLTWEWKYYETLAKAIKESAKAVGVPIEWGGDWKSFKDGVHFQLPVSVYP